MSQSREEKEIPNLKLKQSLRVLHLKVFVEFLPTICQAVGQALCLDNNEQKHSAVFFSWSLRWAGRETVIKIILTNKNYFVNENAPNLESIDGWTINLPNEWLKLYT